MRGLYSPSLTVILPKQISASRYCFPRLGLWPWLLGWRMPTESGCSCSSGKEELVEDYKLEVPVERSWKLVILWYVSLLSGDSTE